MADSKFTPIPIPAPIAPAPKPPQERPLERTPVKVMPRFMLPTQVSSIRGVLAHAQVEQRKVEPFSSVRRAPSKDTTSGADELFETVKGLVHEDTPGPGTYLPIDYNSAFQKRPSSASPSVSRRGRPTTPVREFSFDQEPYRGTRATTPGPGAYNLGVAQKKKYIGPPVFMGSVPRFGSVPLTGESARVRQFAPEPMRVRVTRAIDLARP